MPSIHFFLDNENTIHIMRRVPQSKTGKSPYRVQVLDRALAALEVLANSSTECSLAEICLTLKLHISTTHRLMMVLEQHRLVEKNVDTGRYRLGLKLYEFGSKAFGAIDLRRQAKPYLDRLQGGQPRSSLLHCGRESDASGVAGRRGERDHPALGTQSHHTEHDHHFF